MKRTTKLKQSKELIAKFYEHNSYCLIIYYSCENSYHTTPRIASIAVRYLATGQTKSFSIHNIAEIEKVPYDQIKENYNDLEKKMLSLFFEFAREHANYYWIHWDMKDINYGFEAIQQRATILGETPYVIRNDNKFDLSRALIDIYGKKCGTNIKLPPILKINDLLFKNWLTKEDETQAFNNNDFIKLHQSALDKVDCFGNIIKLCAEGKLKIESNKKWLNFFKNKSYTY